MKSKHIALLPALLISAATASAQTTASKSMATTEHAPIVAFNISDEGVRQPVRWGIDTAWRWDWWPLRATNHMQECVSLGRVTIDPRTSGSYTELTETQQSGLDEQLSWLKKSGVTDLYLLAGNASGSAWSTSFRTPFIKDIALTVEYLKTKGYNVIAISPFNEPDYWSNHAPDASEMATVAKLMHQNSVLKDIDIAGPSCLNCDYANAWWSTMEDAVDIGNTHQLAGTFDTFAGFYAAVQASGKKSAGDEMHNINDALVGMNYGMSHGIWWSDFGGYTRAELGRTSNNGSRIAYRENRSAWTTAAVFKCDSENLAEAFLGTSERQAGESAYTFVSQDRLAYYDSFGPYYEYTKRTKGGTGYQTGQTNSEYVIEITYGEDIPAGPITGSFKLVNKETGKLLTANSLSSNGDISQQTENTGRNQSWTITPLNETQAGDFSYVTITSTANKSLYLDAQKYDGSNGARILLYSGGGNECERWHLRYKGNGYYVITNHDSGLSLEGSSDNTSATSTDVVQWARTGSDRQLWKLVPADATVESTPPAKPLALKASPLSASIQLSWQANTEDDILGYMIYRYNDSAKIWETIARQVTGTSFIDNASRKGQTCKYRIRAIDKAWNLSDASDEVTCTAGSGKALVGNWTFASDSCDSQENHFDALITGGTFSNDGIRGGITLDGTDDYISLPYNIADHKTLTFCAWVKPTSTTAWQRIFDFGSSTDNYMFLTPSNGSVLRFEICKDGSKQGLNATKRLTAGTWTFVTLTIGTDSVNIYINGELNATTTGISLHPSDINPLLNYLGRSMFSADPMFAGTISHARLYNYALNADEVNQLYYSSQISDATDLLAQPMNKTTKSTLSKALQTATDAISEGNTATINSALTSLGKAMSTASKSAEAYKPLGEALAWSKQTAEAHPQTTAGALETYEAEYAEEEAKYLGGEYSNARVSLQISTVKAITNKYVMADAPSTATEAEPMDISFLLRNEDFQGNTSDNWTITTGRTGYEGTLDYNCIEFYNCTFNISQALGNMPNGIYRISTQAFYRNGTKDNSKSTDVNAYLYIGTDTTKTLTPISRNANTKNGDGDWYEYATGKYVPNDIESAAYAFNSLSRFRPSTLFGLNYVDGTYDSSAANKLVVGIKKTTAVADDWTVINYIKLYYLGDPNHFAAQDVNKDGTVDTQDVLTIYDYIESSKAEESPREDVNGDGVVDTQDVLNVYEHMREN